MEAQTPKLLKNCEGCCCLIADNDPMPALVRKFSEFEWHGDPPPGEDNDILLRAKRRPLVNLCMPCQLAKMYGKYKTHRDGIFEAVSAIAVAVLDEEETSHLLTQEFMEDVFVALIRRRLFSSDPDWRDDDPLTFHVDPMTDPSGWDAVRAEFARALWLRREHLSFPALAARIEREFGPEVAADALQLIAREALDECLLLSRLGEVRDPCDFRNAPHPALRFSAKDLRTQRKTIRTVEQFLTFCDCVSDRLEAQSVGLE